MITCSSVYSGVNERSYRNIHLIFPLIDPIGTVPVYITVPSRYEDRIKRILKYQTDMKIEELRINLKISHKVLDLGEEFDQTQSSAERINTKLIDISEFATQIINIRFDHFLKTKDVLTTDQKNKLLAVLLLIM